MVCVYSCVYTYIHTHSIGSSFVKNPDLHTQ